VPGRTGSIGSTGALGRRSSPCLRPLAPSTGLVDRDSPRLPSIGIGKTSRRKFCSQQSQSEIRSENTLCAVSTLSVASVREELATHQCELWSYNETVSIQRFSFLEQRFVEGVLLTTNSVRACLSGEEPRGRDADRRFVYRRERKRRRNLLIWISRIATFSIGNGHFLEAEKKWIFFVFYLLIRPIKSKRFLAVFADAL
jgi:hypothetical protein